MTQLIAATVGTSSDLKSKYICKSNIFCRPKVAEPFHIYTVVSEFILYGCAEKGV